MDRKDGRHERFITPSRQISVSMSLADYEAEKKRCFNRGELMGELKGQRHLLFILEQVRLKVYTPEVIVQAQLNEEEYKTLLQVAGILYGP